MSSLQAATPGAVKSHLEPQTGKSRTRSRPWQWALSVLCVLVVSISSLIAYRARHVHVDLFSSAVGIAPSGARVLVPAHPMLSTPNRISARDFDGWIEQRGSKFLTQLDPEYTALVETHDAGQPPQTGVWVTARVGAGQWTYVALALHRQLPYAVPGAFRILANLLSRPAAR